MTLLKRTEEYRVENDIEAETAIKNFREEAVKEGYILAAAGYTHKEKKVKGEIIDDGELLKVVKVYGGFWD